jgi:hypothetical protein
LAATPARCARRSPQRQHTTSVSPAGTNASRPTTVWRSSTILRSTKANSAKRIRMTWKIVSMVKCALLPTLRTRSPSTFCIRWSPRTLISIYSTSRQLGAPGVTTMTRKIVSMHIIGRTCEGSLSCTTMRRSFVRIGRLRISLDPTQMAVKTSTDAPTVTVGKSSSTTQGTTRSTLASSMGSARSTIVPTTIRRRTVVIQSTQISSSCPGTEEVTSARSIHTFHCTRICS